MILSFELNLRPLAHQSVRFGRGGIKYKPKKVLDYQKYVRVNQKFIRPNEPQKLCGDSSKAQKILGWKPSLSFTELVHEMCEAVSLK